MKPAVEVAHEWLAKTGLGQTDECRPNLHGVDCNALSMLVVEVRQDTRHEMAMAVTKPGHA